MAYGEREIMKKTIVLMALMLICGITLSWGQQTIPEEARRHMVRGQEAAETAKSARDYKEAIAEFEQARALAPDWPDVYFNLGMVQGTVGNYDEAIGNLKKYLNLVPNAEDAARVRDNIYKLEYKRDRSNIVGVWRVDKNELAVQCDPPGGAYGKGHVMSALFLIEDIRLEVRKTSGDLEARILSSKNRFPGSVPDGPFVPVQRDGDMVKIFDAVMYTCKNVIRDDNCPWEVKFVMKQVAADMMEGSIELQGIVEKVVSYQKFTLETTAFSGNGKIIMKREKN
jgi:hypothetical protein